jgi:hypothetical protein
MRNHFEHYDERLDIWWRTSTNHIIVDMVVGPRGWVMDGVAESDMFRQFDPTTRDVIFWGEAFNIQRIVDEVQRLLPIAAPEAGKPHWEPPPTCLAAASSTHRHAPTPYRNARRGCTPTAYAVRRVAPDSRAKPALGWLIMRPRSHAFREAFSQSLLVKPLIAYVVWLIVVSVSFGLLGVSIYAAAPLAAGTGGAVVTVVSRALGEKEPETNK